VDLVHQGEYGLWKEIVPVDRSLSLAQNGSDRFRQVPTDSEAKVADFRHFMSSLVDVPAWLESNQALNNTIGTFGARGRARPARMVG